MNKQALKATEIETFALSTSAALDELRRPVSHVAETILRASVL